MWTKTAYCILHDCMLVLGGKNFSRFLGGPKWNIWKKRVKQNQSEGTEIRNVLLFWGKTFIMSSWIKNWTDIFSTSFYENHVSVDGQRLRWIKKNLGWVRFPQLCLFTLRFYIYFCILYSVFYLPCSIYSIVFCILSGSHKLATIYIISKINVKNIWFLKS